MHALAMTIAWQNYRRFWAIRNMPFQFSRADMAWHIKNAYYMLRTTRVQRLENEIAMKAHYGNMD